MITIIDSCLRSSTLVPSIETIADWWPRWKAVAEPKAQPIERAIAGGYDADRVAWAFAAGYQAALRALVPDLPGNALVALCVTEESGNRPRDMRTTISHNADGTRAITGAKRWTTLGTESTLLLVVGALAETATGERPSLKVARVPADAAGLTLLPMPPTRFVPEVPHAQVLLHEVPLPRDALLAGDGYSDYVKPFRTIEDTHVTAAVLAYLLREARARAWPNEFAETAAAAIAGLCQVARSAVDAPATHVVLAGALQWSQQLYREATAYFATSSDDPAAVRWQRDSALFDVASTARQQRAVKAWENLTAQSGQA
jgi:acyl-CoA dehydrogenase